jgi:rRNA maturation protein Nop10
MTCMSSEQPKILAGPQCEHCGGTTRIVRIEPHSRLKRRHIWTLECLSCGAAHYVEMPAPTRTH